MAWRYGSEHSVAEFKDLQASAMAIDCLGNWVLLAGRKNLSFVDLTRPNQSIVKVTQLSKWDISSVQWNCHASHAHRFVTARNQRLDVFDFKDASASHLCSMKAHSRTISDVDWSPFDVNIVASCSVDTFTYFWDVRDSKKPVKSFQTVSGAYQVKWNKVTNNLFATTHDGDVRIWDPRKGNTPVGYIAAHPSKIHGLDWSNKDQHKLVTASQDCTIRLWDYNTPRRTEAMIKTGSPVWRARYTPFGAGLVSVVVPQLRRGENSLSLWFKNNSEVPVHTFVGHRDVIVEFQWRKQLEGTRDHQLVTWSKDQSLRIWKVDLAMQRLCGHEITEEQSGETTHEDILSLSSMRSDKDMLRLHLNTEAENRPVFNHSALTAALNSNTNPMDVLSFEKEIENLSHKISGVSLEKVDIKKRICCLKLKRSLKYLDFELFFPINYPMEACPTITIVKSNLDNDTQTRVVKMFADVCTKLVNQCTNCVETGLKQILPIIEQSRIYSQDVQSREERKVMLENKYHVKPVTSPNSPISPNMTSPMFPTGSFQDSSVPFPRTSGARFCSNDRLVVFSVPATVKKVHEDMQHTPRAISDLVTNTSQWMRSQSSFSLSMFIGSPSPNMSAVSISDFFTEKHTKSRHRQTVYGSHHGGHHGGHHRNSGMRSSRETGEQRREREKETERLSKKLQKVGCIKVYDISNINPMSKFLAENYKLDFHNIPKTCDYNATVALKIGRKDLAQLWKLICQMCNPSLSPLQNVDKGPPWAYSPFGRRMVEKLLNHYQSVRDIQTMAMICCMFWDKDPPVRDSMSAAITRQDSRLSFEYAAAHPYNPYHTVSSVTNLLKGWTSTVMKNKRSLSWSNSNSFEEIKMLEEKDPRQREEEREKLLHYNNTRMLDPDLNQQHEQIKKAYADVLYKWNLLNKRTEVLKHTDNTGAHRVAIDVVVSCHNCHESVSSAQCNSCTYPALRCAICHIGVKGIANFCLACGHGGHTKHMKDWFADQTVCPTGCGCLCLHENTSGLHMELNTSLQKQQ